MKIIKEMVMMMIIMMTTGLPIVKIEVINHERGNVMMIMMNLIMII